MSKRILVLLGHPDKKSFCNALADAYILGAKESGAEVVRINISDLAFDINLRMGYKIDQKLELDLIKAQTQIKWADHIVWFFPIWWGIYPAIMKGFIDRVFIPGFAFKFTGKFLWDRLLKGRSSRFVVTMGNYRLVYHLLLSPGTTALWYNLRLFGMRPIRMTFFARLRRKSEKRLNKYLARIKKMGQKQK